jgi:hypothetical protein
LVSNVIDEAFMNSASDLVLNPIPGAEREGVSQSVHAPAQQPSQIVRRYCVLLLVIPVLAVLGCIRLGYSDFFIHHGASVWAQSNDAVFDMHGRACDVLIFGDSTAMTGIDPERVERYTGFKTCNIAVTNAVLAVTHNLTLDHFLANNPKPRVLLIQLSPDGFQPQSSTWTTTVYPEGMLELLRHGSSAQNRRVLLRHPQEVVAFAGYAAGFTLYATIKSFWYHLTNIRPDEDAVTIHNGFFTPPSPARKSCGPAVPLPNPSAGGEYARHVVDEYQRKYSNASRVVLVNVAPIPSCDRNLAVFSSQLNGVTSNSLLPLPVGLFNDTRHFTADGSAMVSRLVSEELNEVADRNPQIHDRRPSSAPALASLRRTQLESSR